MGPTFFKCFLFIYILHVSDFQQQYRPELSHTEDITSTDSADNPSRNHHLIQATRVTRDLTEYVDSSINTD